MLCLGQGFVAAAGGRGAYQGDQPIQLFIGSGKLGGQVFLRGRDLIRPAMHGTIQAVDGGVQLLAHPFDGRGGLGGVVGEGAGWNGRFLEGLLEMHDFGIGFRQLGDVSIALMENRKQPLQLTIGPGDLLRHVILCGAHFCRPASDGGMQLRKQFVIRSSHESSCQSESKQFQLGL